MKSQVPLLVLRINTFVNPGLIIPTGSFKSMDFKKKKE